MLTVKCQFEQISNEFDMIIYEPHRQWKTVSHWGCGNQKDVVSELCSYSDNGGSHVVIDWLIEDALCWS